MIWYEAARFAHASRYLQMALVSLCVKLGPSGHTGVDPVCREDFYGTWLAGEW